MRLSNQTLHQLPAALERPRYDRDVLTPGIVHIGLGNFHRAHQAWYLHRLMQDGLAQDWAILGAGVRAYDAKMRDRLRSQDCLTTLIELTPKGASAEITGSMIDYIPVEQGNAPLIAAMSDPRIRIVSLTVTEGGYYLDPVTGAFDAAHPDIAHDAANPDTPCTAFGAMVAALKARRAAGHGPFTGQSCDNLQGNGSMLQQAVVSLAAMSDPELAEWIEASCSFPNSMVDCIVPATGPDEIATVQSLGVDDVAPVTHEPFRQWVMEDKFCAGRPPWEKAGAILTNDVHAYEAMKLRLLNAGHQVVANVGEVLGIETIAETMTHAGIAGLLDRVSRQEIGPHVTPVPEMSVDSYVTLVQQRFANPAILDTTRRVAFDGSARHTGFLIPTIRDALVAGGEVSGLALCEAFWARMCVGTREDGSVIEPNDPHWDRLTEVAKEARDRPMAWIEQSDLYGTLSQDQSFASAFSGWLQMIWTDGAEMALTAYAARGN